MLGSTSVSLMSDESFFDESSAKVTELKKSLDSKQNKERINAMKTLIAVLKW